MKNEFMSQNISVNQPQISVNQCYDNAGNRFIKETDDQTTIYLRHGQIAVAMD